MANPTASDLEPMDTARRAASLCRPLILGCPGFRLDDAEKAFFRAARPWGFILFARNIDTPAQIVDLVCELRDCAGYHAPVLIDQEGGRVARLRGGLAHALPPMARLGDLAARDPDGAVAAADLIGRLLAHDLARYGIDVDCAPVADVPGPDAHEVIGDRAFATDPAWVGRLARSLAQGLTRGGCLPVVKHIPGHGRAKADSHLELPRVDTPRAALEASDFAPFRALADQPLAMTAHVLYTAVDPALPATLSRVVMDEVVRGFIGFDGAVMTDDLSMKALGGAFADRARDALAAGCDLLLHCNGDPIEMRAILAADPQFDTKGVERAARALAARRPADAFDLAEARARLEALLPGQVH